MGGSQFNAPSQGRPSSALPPPPPSSSSGRRNKAPPSPHHSRRGKKNIYPPAPTAVVASDTAIAICRVWPWYARLFLAPATLLLRTITSSTLFYMLISIGPFFLPAGPSPGNNWKTEERTTPPKKKKNSKRRTRITKEMCRLDSLRTVIIIIIIKRQCARHTSIEHRAPQQTEVSLYFIFLPGALPVSVAMHQRCQQTSARAHISFPFYFEQKKHNHFKYDLCVPSHFTFLEIIFFLPSLLMLQLPPLLHT